MPGYLYKCPVCLHSFEVYAAIKDYSSTHPCKCGATARQIITAPMLIIPAHMRATGAGGYESPIDGRQITNTRARREDLARSGCIEYDPGMKQDADRRLIEEDIALDRAVDETVERAFDAMPVRKKEKLETELLGGVTAEPIRTTA